MEETKSNSLHDLPTSLIVTNIDAEVFQSNILKEEVENLFRKISDRVNFQWLKSFHRLRVNYNDAMSAGIKFLHFSILQNCLLIILMLYFSKSSNSVA